MAFASHLTQRAALNDRATSFVRTAKELSDWLRLVKFQARTNEFPAFCKRTCRATEFEVIDVDHQQKA